MRENQDIGRTSIVETSVEERTAPVVLQPGFESAVIVPPSRTNCQD